MKNANIIKEAIELAHQYGVPVDRYNNIKWASMTTGNIVRFNFKKNVIRFEEYIPSIKEWARKKSFSVAKLDLDAWVKQLKHIKGDMI